VDHLHQAADSWRDLSDPVLIAKAWDEPSMSDVQPATDSCGDSASSRISQLPTTSMIRYPTRKSMRGKAIRPR